MTSSQDVFTKRAATTEEDWPVTVRKMRDSTNNLERSKASTMRRHDGQELQASVTPRYKKARKSGDRVPRQLRGYSRNQGGTRIRSYAPSQGGGCSQDCPGQGQGHQDKRRQQDGRRCDKDRRCDTPPRRDRDKDMHLADGKRQQSVVKSDVLPSLSQELTGSVLP